MMDRRAFLLAGVGAVAAACSAGGGPSGAPAPTGSSVLPTTSGSVPPEPADWATLKSKVSGGLLRPGDAGFDTAYRGFNSLRDGRKPAAVALCKTPEDVQACVELARRSRTPIAAKSGGHSYAGYCVPENGLQVDLKGMAAVDVRPDGTVRIGPGAHLVDVYTELAKAGRCLPAGSCPTVGVAGLTLGGGIGVLSRKYGLTCDRLDSVTIVPADSRLVPATRSTDTDLFWALRGGGGGNFGIATEFIFSTDAAPQLTVFSLRFPAGSAANVLGAWQEWISRIPHELWTNLVITGGSPPTCRVGGCFVGSAGELNSVLAGFKPAAKSMSRSVQEKSYLDAMKYFAGSGSPSRESFVASSRIVPGPVADPAAMVALVAGKPDTDVLLDSLGGAVAEVDPTATAFPHRKALASAQIYTRATATAERATAQVNDVRDGLGSMVGNTGYVNYIDPDMPDWASAYYGPNLDRLKTIAKQIDPDRVFNFPQAVPS
jgi:FAD/FMN-containing dehydrogenase